MHTVPWETRKYTNTESLFPRFRRTTFQFLPHGDAIKCLLLLILCVLVQALAKVNIIIIIPTATSIFLSRML